MNKSYIKMKFSLALAAIFMMILGSAYAQQTVTIGSEDLNPRAILKLEGDGSQGFLLPIADKDDFIPQASDAGMLIYDSSDNLVYFWNGSAWVSVNTSTGGGGSSFGLVLDAATGELSIVENGGNSNVSISLAQVDGDITGTIGNTTIADGAVTLNKIANNGNIRSLLANSSGGVVGWLSPNSDNQVLGTDGTGDLTFRDVVDASTGIADAASASDSRLVTEAAIRDALEAAGVSQSLQGAYDGGDGTIQMNSAKNINITNSASNSILSIDHDAQSVGIGVESSFAKLSVNGRVAIFGNGDIGTALDNIPPIDLAIDDSDTGFEVAGDGNLTIVTDGQEQASIRVDNYRIGNNDATDRVILSRGDIDFDGEFRPGGSVGDAGQVLTSQGGGLSPIWATSSGSSPWTINGSDIFYSSGRVGIGINTPVDALDVDGNISVSAGSGFLLENTQLISGNISLNNIYIGPFAGGSITTGTTNFFAGVNTGVSTDAGFSNTFVGSFSGEANTSGEENVFLGAASGQNNTTGNFNVMLGLAAGILNTTGSNNVLMGYNANVGANNLTNAIAIGSDAVVSNSNRMVLGQSGTDIQFDGALLPANNAGTSGQILTSSGPGAAPTWTTVAGATSTLQGAYDGGNTIGMTTSRDLLIETSTSYPLFTLEESSGRAGIGTPSPTARLTVTHGGTANGEALELRGDGTGANTLPLLLWDAADTRFAGFASPSSLLSNYILNLPNDLPTAAGQVLTSDLVGNLSWSSAGSSSLQGAYDGGGNVINLDGTNELTINTSSSNPLLVTDNTNANIGIRTNTPIHTLDVDGNIGVSVDHGFFLGNVRFLGGSTTNDNVFIGGRAGNLFSTGSGNVFVGTNTGGETDDVAGNTFVGNNAGLRNTDASENTFIGAGAGEENTTGNQNTFLGVISGSLNLSGSRLTLLGYNSNTSVDGLTNATAIGHDAVVSNSNRMVLGVSGTDIQFDGALMPNNDAGLAGQVLTSAGPGATPTWGTASGSGWSLLGNASTNPTTNFIGTTDDVALEIRVNNTRVSRLEIDTSPFTAGTLIPNIISGHVDNRVTDGVKGAVISGGGDTNPNTADGDWAAVGGGRDNHAGSLSPYAAYATIGGGASNVATGQWSTIPGGKNVTVTGRGAYANGIRTNSESLGLTVVGTSNELLAGLDTDNWVETDPVFIVGNGEVNTAGNIVDRTNAMTVLKNGNVGIGTSAPNTILEVSSGGTTTSRLTSTSGDVALELLRTGNSNVDYRFFSDGNDDFLKLQYSGNDFGTNNDALFISDVGDLGVGISPSTSLHVRHPGGISTSSLGEGISLSNGTRSSRWTITHEYNSIGTLEDFQFSYNGSLVAQINQSGAYSQVSDLRLKENIKNINGVLGQLMKLRPVTYQFRKDTDHREKIGFIAQEVKELFPTLVNGSGKIVNGEIDYFSLDYANMSVINVKAIQEQQKIIEKQGREIELLKEKLTTKEKDSAEIKSELETLKAQVDTLSNLIKAEAKND